MIDRPAALYEIERLEEELEAACKLIERQCEVLDECEDYFANRQDADCIGDPPRYVPNEEMRILLLIKQLRGE